MTPTKIEISQKIYAYYTLVVVLSVVLLLLGCGTANAQQLTAATYLESSRIGLQKGASVGLETSFGLHTSIFYQASEKISLEEDANNYPFAGFEVSYKLVNCGSLSLEPGFRTGIVNANFLIVSPQVTTRLQLNHWLSSGLTMTYRAGQPAIGTSIRIHI